MQTLRCVGLAAALIGGAAAVQAAAPPLRLCADPTNLPFSSNAPEAVAKGAPGLYVEIGQAVANALGRELQPVWSLSYFGKRNIRTTLLAGQCDFAVGLPAEGEFMGPRLVFSRPILKMGYALVVPKAQAAGRLDDLVGKRVAVQYATPPQSVLAVRNDITAVTVMSPEEGMQRLAAGDADAAFLWGPNASYVNHTALRDAYKVIPVDAPQMQWQASIGFASRDKALRDEVDGVLTTLQPRIRELAAKYAVAVAPAGANAPVVVSQGVRLHFVANESDAKPAAGAKPAEGKAADADGNTKAGHEVFNGTCAHCHGPDAVVADRKINLRRLKAKYGDEMPEVFYATVTNGRPTKGMPAWKDVFKQQDFVNILTYLKTVQEP
jgi:ABC-type amino acid transport substrate-binding protein/mono/diheme cytochrome c family protein